MKSVACYLSHRVALTLFDDGCRVFPLMLECSYWNTAFVYVFAEFFGAVIAAALVLPLYGFGQFGSLFDTRVFKTFGLAVPKHLAQVTRPLPVL